MGADLVISEHDQLIGLSDDDHVQYALADKSRPSPWVAASDLSGLSIADLGTRDHDLLTGLNDDDHVQYLLINGTRAMTGALDMGTNGINNAAHIRNVGGNLDIGGTVADPYLRNPGAWSGQFWPTARTITAAQNPVIQWSQIDAFSWANGTYPGFINAQRLAVNSVAYNSFAMHSSIVLQNNFQNSNGVVANLGLYIGITDSTVQRADAANLSTIGSVTMFSNPALATANAGGLAATYMVNAYLAGTIGTNCLASFFIHLWVVNPGGAGAINNEYGMWIQNMTKSVNSYGIYSQLAAGATKWFLFQTAGGAKIQLTGDLGFYGTAPAAQQTVTGSRGGNAALASLLTALANYGLIIDNSTV